MFYADLHNHTTASDGDYTPETLISIMARLGVSAVGVTDHDTVGGLETALEQGTRLGIEVVPGVEVSVRFKESFFTGTLHLLCYFSPDLLKNHEFIDTLKTTLGKGRGEALIRARVAEINRIFGPEGDEAVLSRPMTHDEIAAYAPSVSRRHFALALAEKHGITDRDQINHVIGNNSPAYLPSGIDIALVKSFTSAFPVVTVLAHPAAGSFPGKGHYREVLPPVETVERLFPRFLDVGLHGIEVSYPGHTLEHRTLLRGWAEKYNLVVTGGSDCHDEVQRPAGVAGISKEQFDIFKSLF
ncbi:hypothetical protein SAMN02746065_105177 [Desulfocicer vacuolatum DSM 3385]|uniref:Polymerase/histidinol phosphatase N-terminal domain-containing protein n=1 Tax=Desulfocicer vacuolatum DSM 3385 TaxID=1121400 RepID=A0A1W2AKE9_9BACT|nr:PHP domain-containing protein [Desulfocicer vacuolatum]SMC61209.1 hypothetical protein SAMN02746065_105177 [Desulfocicer vacuolatum DSM 3385]